MISKLATVLSLLLVSSPSFAEFYECGQLAGRYVGVESRFRYFEISLDASRARFRYDDDLNRPDEGYGFSLVADGLEHAGDDPMNTGTSYVAECSPNGIRIVRKGMFIKPYTTTFTTENGILTELDTVEGFETHTSTYRRAR